MRGLPVVAIAQETGIERKRVLRALTYVRMAFQKDIPEVFSGTVEVDETYLGGQWKNKRHSAKSGGTKRGRGTSKTPVFGILCRGGKVWAQVVPDVEAKTLMPLISRRVKAGSIVCSDTWKSYTGVAAKGYVHRLVKHHKGEYSDGKGNHINGLGDILKEGWPRKAVSGRNGCLFTWLNMSGVTIIEMITSKTRKNSL